MKIGRNDACPCGSGKKYKHCCLRSQEAGSLGPSENPYQVDDKGLCQKDGYPVYVFRPNDPDKAIDFVVQAIDMQDEAIAPLNLDDYQLAGRLGAKGSFVFICDETGKKQGTLRDGDTIALRKEAGVYMPMGMELGSYRPEPRTVQFSSGQTYTAYPYMPFLASVPGKKELLPALRGLHPHTPAPDRCRTSRVIDVRDPEKDLSPEAQQERMAAANKIGGWVWMMQCHRPIEKDDRWCLSCWAVMESKGTA